MKIVFTITILSICFISSAQHPWLVKDINTNSPVNQLNNGTYIGSASSMMNSTNALAPREMYKVGSFALFFADDGKGKRGLWRSDGTEDSTYFISSLGMDTSKSLYISDAYSDGRLLYFQIPLFDQDQYHYANLWRSDGTSQGTFPIFSGFDKKIAEAWNYKKYRSPTIGNYFFFIGGEQKGDTVFTNLYKTDGTAAGTTIYFQMYKIKGSISDAFTVGGGMIIEFNNQVYFTYYTHDQGSEIWKGNGVTSPALVCDFTPDSLGTICYDWVNVNNYYLFISAGIENSSDTLIDKILRIKSTEDCPVIIEDTLGAYLSTFFADGLNNEYHVLNDKLFFSKRAKGLGTPGLIEVTNGEREGTFTRNYNNDGLDRDAINGDCSKGIIFTSGIIDTKTYIWDGSSTNSYHIFSDSLNATEANGYFTPYQVLQLDTVLLIIGSDYIVWQTNIDGSYCYRVSGLYMEKGVNLGDTAYLAFGDGFPRGTFPCGTEPVLLKKADKIWTGKISSDWNNGNNWLPAGVPKLSESVVIPVVAKYPIISNNADCKNLFLNYGDKRFYGSITVNKSTNLNIHGLVLNYGEINGEGSITRKGTFANTTYGDGVYNIDSINIDGSDWDLTSVDPYPYSVFDLNSIINFKSDNKLIMNETSLNLHKIPLITGFNNKRYIVNNRINHLRDGGINMVSLYYFGSASSTDSIGTVPLGTSTSSYSPLTFTYRPYIYNISAYLSNEVRKNGSSGDLIANGVVNKTWFVQIHGGYLNKVKLSWSIKDEAPGFNHNFCFIAYYDGSKWIKGVVQAAVLNDGLYSIEQLFPSFNAPFIVCSDFNVLPVNIISFTAELINGNISAQLKWKTLTETNSSYYNIRRSTDGVNFTTVGRVNAAASSTSVKTYGYTDNVAKLAGTIYYQIEEVDKDGKTTLSQIRSVRKLTPSVFAISPNPAKDVVNITGNHLRQVRIYDVNGKVVVVKEINNASYITIDLLNLVKGIYMIVVEDNQGNSETKKLTVY